MLRNILLVIAAVLVPVFALSQPKIEFVGGETKDWGKVTPKQSPLKHNLVIKNAGNQDLKITRLKPTCGCTTAPLKKDELKPGESTTVEVTLNIQATSGALHKQIAVESNDPNRPYINYMLKAEVVLPLTISPTTYLSFQDLQVGMESVSKLRIKNTSDMNITISDFEMMPAGMSINLKNKQILKPGQEIELVAKVRPTQTGNLSAKISMKTSHPEFPELTINGFGSVKPSAFYNN